jgi:cytochrome P450
VRFQAIPGPRGYPLLGAFPQARRDPLGFFLAAQRTYGDVVALPLGVRRLYLLCHPDHIKDVLQDHESVFHKSVAAERIKPLFGESLTTVDGEIGIDAAV